MLAAPKFRKDVKEYHSTPFYRALLQLVKYDFMRELLQKSKNELNKIRIYKKYFLNGINGTKLDNSKRKKPTFFYVLIAFWD